MNPKTRFLKWYYKSHEKARNELWFEPFGLKAMTLRIVAFEVRHDTLIGRYCLESLGYVHSATEVQDAKVSGSNAGFTLNERPARKEQLPKTTSIKRIGRKEREDGWCSVCGKGAIESGMTRCENHKKKVR